MQIITNNVDNQRWDDAGGPGSISEYNGLIVVTQTAQTHKKVGMFSTCSARPRGWKCRSRRKWSVE